MPNPKKNIRTFRSREDYDLFRVAMQPYNPEAILDLTITVSPGDYLSPELPIGRARHRNGPSQGESEEQAVGEGWWEQMLTTNLAGTV